LKELLPINPQPISDEWLGSWLLRLAQANTMPLRYLLEHFGLGLESLPLSVGTIRKLSRLTAQKPSNLTDLLETPTFALQHKPQSRRSDLSYTQLLSAQRVQLCIPCLQSDDIPYIRKAWMSRAAYCCQLHRVHLLRRCPRCRAVLFVLHEFGRLADHLNSDVSLLLTCLKCGYDLRDFEATSARSTQVRKLNYTLLPVHRWPDFTLSFYLFIEKYQLNTLIDIDNICIIKGLPLDRVAALENINTIGRTHVFFDDLLFYLTSGSQSINIDLLRSFGTLCSSIAEVSVNVTRLSAARFHWLGDILTREPEEWLASNIQAILYALTLDDAPWVRIDPEIKFSLSQHQESIVSKRVFGQPGLHRKAGFRRFIKFLSIAARSPSYYDMMSRLMRNKHSNVPLNCYEKNFVASVFADLYVDHKMTWPRTNDQMPLHGYTSLYSNTEKLLHSFGTLELLRLHNYKIFRLILSNYANSRTRTAHT
jgi:TniQ